MKYGHIAFHEMICSVRHIKQFSCCKCSGSFSLNVSREEVLLGAVEMLEQVRSTSDRISALAELIELRTRSNLMA